MAWPALIANDVMPGEPVSKAANTTGEMLFLRDLYVLSKGTSYVFAETSEADTSYALQFSQKVRIPSNMEVDDDISITLEIWNGTAGKTTYWQLKDNGSGSTGTEASTVGTTHAWEASTLAIEAGWMGTLRTIEVWAKTEAGGTAYISGENMLANCWFVGV